MSHFEELRARQREEHLQFHQKLILELEKSQDNRTARNPIIVSTKSADEQVKNQFNVFYKYCKIEKCYST